MIKINLLAPESIKKEERNEILFIGYLVAVLILVVAVAQYGIKLRSYSKVEARISKAEQELSKYQDIVKQADALQATKRVLETKKNVINTLMISRLIYPQFMESIAQMLPSNVWVKTLNTQMQADGKLMVTIDAEALDNYSIADFITALSSNQSFSNVELGPLSSNATGKIATSAFRLTFQYKRKS